MSIIDLTGPARRAPIAVQLRPGHAARDGRLADPASDTYFLGLGRGDR